MPIQKNVDQLVLDSWNSPIQIKSEKNIQTEITLLSMLVVRNFINNINLEKLG